MKKFLLVAAIAVFGMGLSNAQDGSLAAGVKLGLPIGDAGDAYTFGVGAEVMYLHPVSDEFTLGGSVGFLNFLGDEQSITFLGQTTTLEVEDAQFLPIAVKAMYNLGDSGFGVGADLGYAVGISDGNDGGLMYEPKVVFNTETLLFSLGYQGIAIEESSFDSIQVGAAFKF